MSDLLIEDPPEVRNEKTRHTWNVGRLKKFLDTTIDCRLRTPVYNLHVKYFDSNHPILLNYKSRWGEYFGNVHCVCMDQLIDLKSPSNIPIRNNRRPIETARDLRNALNAFDDSLFLVLCYFDASTLTQLSAYTFCDAYELGVHEYGSAIRYVYSNDGLNIIGFERLNVPKIEFDFPFVSLCWYEPKANVIFTNVSRSYATHLRQKVQQQYNEFINTL
jgi:hypothetical protein